MGFEPTIPAGELPQTYALDRAATGTDVLVVWSQYLVLTTLSDIYCQTGTYYPG